MTSHNSTFATNVSPIVFDIETMGLPNATDYLDPITRDESPIEADKRLTDPAKIAQSIADKAAAREAAYQEKVAARLDKLALDWNVGRVAVIGWQTDQELDPVVSALRDEQDERAALADFWQRSKHRTLTGFNIKGFDLRFMVQRSRYLRVPHPVLDLGRYGKQGITDLFAELTFNEGHFASGAMRQTLQAFCRRFGIPVEDTSTGADVAALLAAGDWQAVVDHCRSDVRLTWALAERLGFVHAQAFEDAAV